MWLIYTWFLDKDPLMTTKVGLPCGFGTRNAVILSDHQITPIFYRRPAPGLTPLSMFPGTILSPKCQRPLSSRWI